MTLLKPSVFHRDKDCAQNVNRCGATSNDKKYHLQMIPAAGGIDCAQIRLQQTNCVCGLQQGWRLACFSALCV